MTVVSQKIFCLMLSEFHIVFCNKKFSDFNFENYYKIHKHKHILNHIIFSVCIPGFGRTSTSSPCEICPTGWYQPDEVNQQCISCGSGGTTMSEGAQNENKCSENI